MTATKPLIMISAGEASGDIHAAHVVNELSSSGFSFDCFGMGADRLQSAGMELTLECEIKNPTYSL